MLILGRKFFLGGGSKSCFDSGREGCQLAAQKVVIDFGTELPHERPCPCGIISQGKRQRGHAALPGLPVTDKLEKRRGNLAVDAGLASGILSAADKGQRLTDE